MKANIFSCLFGLFLVSNIISNVAAQNSNEFDSDYGADEVEEFTIGYLDKGEGATVVFFHPNADASYWQFTVEEVAKSYRVIALPLNTNVPPLFAQFFNNLNLTVLMEGVNLGLEEPPHLVAHSMGGAMALQFAIARPELISSLTVIEPALAPDNESLGRLRTAAAESDVTCPLPNVPPEDQTMCRFHVFINEPGFYDNAPEGLLALITQPNPVSRPAPPALEMLWPPAMPPICETLGELEMPILFIRGELTPKPIQDSQDAYEACLPDHETAVISDSSHYPFIYNPAAFNTALLKFLNNLSMSGTSKE